MEMDVVPERPFFHLNANQLWRVFLTKELTRRELELLLQECGMRSKRKVRDLAREIEKVLLS